MNYTRRMRGNELVIFDENGNELLCIKETAENGCMNFCLVGELRNEIAYEFEDELAAVLTVCHNVRIDLSGLTFIASAGLHTLLRTQQMTDKMPDGRLIISGISEQVMTVFESSGFVDLFDFELKEGGAV